MPHSSPAIRIDLPRARAHWHRNQGLAERKQGNLAEIVGATGWPRTLGGVEAYLAVRARVPEMRRSDLDEAIATSTLMVLPAVRGCIYLVPRDRAALVLRVAEEQYKKRVERDLAKVDVSEGEIADVAKAALATLKKGPMSTDTLRKAMPVGVVRSLGEMGKKVGMSSTLPTALRYLEFEGKVERTLEGGRLDTERYEWRRSAKNLFADAKVPTDRLERYAELARDFFQHAGPATLDDFAAWTSLSQKDAREAALRAGLAPVAVEGYSEEAFVLEADLPSLREPASTEAKFAMLPFEDNYVVLHGGPAHITDPKHHERGMPVWGRTRGKTLGDIKHTSMRSLLRGDKLVGMWEYDPDAQRVVFGTFEVLSAKERSAAAELAEDVGRFLREELGHAKSFTLDTEDALRRRAAVVNTL